MTTVEVGGGASGSAADVAQVRSPTDNSELLALARERGAEAVVLFDGVCNLCNSAVQFILDRDPKRRLVFASLQSDVGVATLASAGLDSTTLDTFVVVDVAGVRVRSAAALRVARYMRWPWPALAILWIVPRPVRDAVYRWVATNRYRWFGKRDSCRLPSADEAHRFLT